MDRRECLVASGLAGITLLAGIALGVPPAWAQDSAIKRGGTLTVARTDEALSLDPFSVSDNGSIYNIAQICEPLILPDDTGRGLVPGVAESWTEADNGLSIELTIREGIKFNDGTDVTAEDVIFSLMKVSDPQGSFAFAFDPISSVDKVDDRTVKLTLSTPYAALKSALSLFAAAIVSKEAYEADPEAFGQAPVCTGPFMVESYERGTQVVMVPNAYYWMEGADGEPLPYVDKVVLRYVPESNSRVLGLQNGDYDASLAIPLNQAASVDEMEGISLEVSPSFRLDYVYLNHANAPFNDPKIRQAVNFAANRDAIMQAVYFGYGELPNSYMPKVAFWSDDVEQIPFDIEMAKQLVEESDYDGTPIQLMVDTGNASFRTAATILQQGWQEAGLNVEIVEYDVGTAFSMTEQGDYQAYVSYITSDINDDDELASIQAEGTGATRGFFSNYNDEEVNDLLSQARQEQDIERRADLYAQVQDKVYHAGYSVPLNFLPYVNGYHDYVQNWQNITVGWWWLRDMWLDK